MEQKEKPVLELNARESSAIINLVSTDLFKSPVPEDEEENPGVFVHFNLDNDDSSDNKVGATKHPGGDCLQIKASVVGEEDLKKARILFPRIRGVVPNGGKILLKVRLVSGRNHARVWKSQKKGEGNKVLVGVYEKSWDLSDPVQRQAFLEIKDNLWVEGMENNSVCLLEVGYKKKINRKWQVVAWEKVKYTFIAADCGNQPRTSERQ
ncbi:MAG: hypothetical protein RMK18_10285 [Armatimonadota bacterium]|nr:hypothetical protein [Armatimonadota bacterium]MDW8026232.1 hypothetical protein [Armatimonadota bacterium]